MNNEQNPINPPTDSVGQPEPSVQTPAPAPGVAPSAQQAGMPSTPAQGAPKNGLAIASLILGILAVLNGIFIIGILFGIVAIVLAILSRRKPGGRGLALGGIIMGAVGILVGIVVWVLAGMLFTGTGLFTVAPLNDSWGAETDKLMATAEAETKAFLPSKKTFEKGETARFGYMDVKVNSIQDNFVPVQPVRSDYDNAFSYAQALSATNPRDGYRFIIVDLTITNKGPEAIIPNERGRIFMTAGGETVYTATAPFSTVEAAVASMSGSSTVVGDLTAFNIFPPLDTFGINPGESSTGKLIYEIKADATDMKLTYTITVYNPETESDTELKYTLPL